MSNTINDESYISKRLLEWLFKTKAYNSMSIIIAVALLLKNLICLVLGITIVIPLLIFDLAIDSIIIIETLRMNKSIHQIPMISEKDFFKTIRWSFNRNQSKVIRPIDYCLIQFMVDGLYLFFYVNQLPEKFLVLLAITLLIVLALIAMVIYIISNIITIYIRYEDILKQN